MPVKGGWPTTLPLTHGHGVKAWRQGHAAALGLAAHRAAVARARPAPGGTRRTTRRRANLGIAVLRHVFLHEIHSAPGAAAGPAVAAPLLSSARTSTRFSIDFSTGTSTRTSTIFPPALQRALHAGARLPPAARQLTQALHLASGPRPRWQNYRSPKRCGWTNEGGRGTNQQRERPACAKAQEGKW